MVLAVWRNTFSLTDSSRRTRFVLGSLWETIWRSIKATHLEKLFINTNSIIGWVLILLGIVDLTIPDYAYRAFGGLVALFLRRLEWLSHC